MPLVVDRTRGVKYRVLSHVHAGHSVFSSVVRVFYRWPAGKTGGSIEHRC